MTRRRHGIPPQPIAWFQNLVALFGDRLTIRVASHEGRPIASILTLSHRDTVVYKYGCSDARYHRLGGMPALFWQAIQDAKNQGFRRLDLGRTDPGNAGLLRFKDGLGATREALTYWRVSRHGGRSAPRAALLFRNIVIRLPDPLFTLAGRILYRHAG